MPVFEDQQAVQQLLSGINSMQMQAGLMPGMMPAQNPAYFQPVRTPSPAEFSNYLNVQHRNDLAVVQGLPPMYAGVTPVTRTDFAQSILPGPQISRGWGMARQQVQGSYNSWMTGTQALAGVGARTAFGMGMGTVGAAVGTMLGGPLGGIVGGIALPYLADSMVGQGVENLATLPFRGFLNQRQRALDLQNATTQFLRTGAEMSPAGAGLGLGNAMDLERNLTRMSQGRGFLRDTRGQFNQQDMVKLTQMAGQVGLLDQAQSVEQITRDMGKIGRALTTFMKVMDEPDVQNAIRMMGNMRNLGMSLPETTTAANNARTFARMAGVSVQNVMQAGMQGAQMFQQMGMSGATGLQAGMAATGSAGILGGILNPRQLSMLGGQEGIARNLTAAAGNVASIDMLLPGLLRRGQNGLEIDQDALLGMATGKQNIQDLARSSAARMRGLGPRGFVEEYSTRRNELRDQLMNSFGGQGAILAPMLIARQIERTGATNFGGALRMQGLSEEQARTIELANTPEFFRRLQQRTAENFEQRAQVFQRRQASYEEASQRRGRRVMERTFGEFYQLGRGVRDIGYQLNNLFRGEFGEEQDLAEQQAFLGGGEILAVTPGNQLGTEEQRRTLEKQLKTNTGRNDIYASMDLVNRQARQRTQRAEQELESQEQSRRQWMRYGTPVVGAFSNYVFENFYGDQGFAFTDIGRGSIGLRRTVTRGESAGTQWGNYFGTRSTAMDTNEVQRRANEMVEGGQLVESARDARFNRERNADLARMAGLDAGQFREARAVASAEFERYTEGLGQGYWSNNGGFSITDARQKVMESLVRHRGMDRAQAQRLVESGDFMREVMRVGAAGRSVEARAVMEKAESTAGDILGVREARTETSARQIAEDSRRSLVRRLGLNPDDLELSQSKQLVNLMSDTGPEADARRKLLRARTLSATGTAEGRRKAALLISEVEESGLTDEQRAGAETAVEAVAGSMDEDVLKRVGEFTGSDAYWKNRDKYEASTAAIATQARAGDFQAGLIGLLGERGADVFKRGRGTEQSMKLLADYIERSGGKLQGSKLSDKDIEDIRRGKLTAEQITERVTGQIKYQARAVVEGGQLATEGGAAPTGANAVTAQIVDVLAAAAQRDQQILQSSFGRFDGAVDKLAGASKDLSAAAAVFAEKNAVATLDQARNNASDKSKNYSMSENYGG